MSAPTASLPLRDIHLPPPPGIWPPPLGWWLLAGLVVVLTLAALWLLRRWRDRRAYRHALAELDSIARAQQHSQEHTQWLSQLSVLLRRHALTVFPRAQVAGLQGRAWLEFLADTGGGDEFVEGAGRWLLHGPFQRDVSVPGEDARALLACARRWLGQSRRPRSAREVSC